MRKLENTLWRVFILSLVVIAIDSVGLLSGTDLSKNFLLGVLIYLTPIVILILHSFDTLRYRGFLFIALVVLTSLFFEALALRTGTVFGGHYVYKNGASGVLGVPWVVIAFWAVFIYTGYSITNSFLLWLNKGKPTKAQGNFWLLPLLVILDGLIVVSIDLLIDPIYVKAGAWRWLEGGAYYGVPLGNFVGWFEVTAVATGIFRLIEYFWPQKKHNFNKLIFLIPVIGYGGMGIALASAARYAGLSSLAITGLLTMFVWVFASISLLISTNCC